MPAKHSTNDRETWKPAIGYEGAYEVSSYGRVRSVRPPDSNRRTPIGYIIKPRVNKGYYSVWLWKGGKNKANRVHHLVLEAFCRSRPDGYQANHINGQKLDNRCSNLEWVTPSQNMQHAIRNGLYVPRRGEECGASRLNSWQVIEIRRLAATMPYAPIAKRFGISESYVSELASGKKWAHLKDAALLAATMEREA